MLTQLTQLVAVVVAQTEQSDGSNPLTIVIALAFIAAAAGCFALYSKLGAIKAQLGEAQTNLTTKDQELRDSQSREKKIQKDLGDKTSAHTKLKHDLAAQKKKVHTIQEESKTLRKTHREEVEKLEKRSTNKTAFQAPAKTEPAKAAAKPEAAPEAAPTAPVEVAPDTAAELDALKTQNDKLKTRLTENKQYISKAKREVKESRGRVERYRRIDIIGRNKTELLEDKLLTLGRNYYDAISEIAALKGEVKPPRPRDLIESEKRAEEARLEAEAKSKEEESAPVTLELTEEPAQADVELEDSDELEHVEGTSTEDTVELDASQVIAENVEAAPAQPTA